MARVAEMRMHIWQEKSKKADNSGGVGVDVRIEEILETG
jgi:hypothetical protein